MERARTLSNPLYMYPCGAVLNKRGSNLEIELTRGGNSSNIVQIGNAEHENRLFICKFTV